MISKKEYSELEEIKSMIEKILKSVPVKEKEVSAQDGFLKAFGILKNDFKGNSVDYVSKLRRECRN